MRTLRKLQLSKGRNVAQLVDYGLVNINELNNNLEPCLIAFFIAPMYEVTVADLFTRDTPAHEILTMATQLLNGIRVLHNSGRTYNDLKPDNVMMHEGQAVLIDFGHAQKFIDENGNHQ